MVPVTPSVNRLISVYVDEPELYRTILSASSPIEVNLALEVLRERAPERALVAAVNVREVLHALPSFPCSMAVDDATLARVSGFEKDRLAWFKPLESGLGISVTTAGNFCFDLIVHDGDDAIFLTPPRGSDIINPGLVDALMRNEGLLEQIIEVVMDMGIVFTPRPYLSLEDWSMDHAQEVMDDLSALF